MAKGISISLAAKCQLLFGLAVVVIIAGALAVPWQRMETLASQKNIQSARILADAALRQLHATVKDGTVSLIPATGPGTAPAATEGDDALANHPFLPDVVTYTAPRIIALTSPTNVPDGADPVTLRAWKLFRTRLKETEDSQVFNEDNKRIYHYAAAVRAGTTCFRCHANWSTWASAEALDISGDAATQGRGTQAAATATTQTTGTQPSTQGAATEETPDSATPPLVAIVRLDLPIQIDENELLLNRIAITVAGMLGGTLAIVVFYLITSRLILQPVRVLRSTAEKVSQGDLNIRSAISTGDEFQQLSETFNSMLSTLKTSQDQLESTNRSLDTRVGELAQMNVDLYEANRMKSEFLTNVSHELRTPLNAIIGFADLLSSAPVLEADPKLARYVENIHTSAKQLLDLINDLLDLAKIEAGKLALREEKINVADVCEAMINFMKPLAQKKSIELSLAVQADIPLLTTDAGRFQQILYNFLSNAVKFTPSEGKVALAAKMEPPDAAVQGPRVRVSVADSGPGIAPEFHESIFEKFRQIDGSVTRHHSGTGLGLAISRELARMLGGKIELTSAAGKGAVFSLILPLTLAQATVDVREQLEMGEVVREP